MNKVNEPLKVLMLLENHVYPNDVRVKPHAELLQQNGYAVTVIGPGEKGYPAYEVINEVRMYRYPFLFAEASKAGYVVEFFTATLFLSLMTLWVWFRQGMDILVLYNPPDILWAVGLIPKLFGKTLVLDIRDLAPELYLSKFPRARSSLLHGMLLMMEQFSCRLANYVVVTNETSRALIHNRDGFPEQNIFVVRQGPDIELVLPVAPDPILRMRAKSIIGYIGNMAPERGIANLLYALHYLDVDFNFHDWYCVLVGKSTAALDVERLADDLGIGRHVWVTGFLPREEWLPLLSATDICVDPGDSNPGNDLSTTNKMMDYMALKKPQVVFDLHERHVTGGTSALYAKSGDVADMAAMIRQLIDAPETCKAMGAEGRKLVEEKWSWQCQRRILLDVFDHTIACRREAISAHASLQE